MSKQSKIHLELSSICLMIWFWFDLCQRRRSEARQHNNQPDLWCYVGLSRYANKLWIWSKKSINYLAYSFLGLLYLRLNQQSDPTIYLTWYLFTSNDYQKLFTVRVGVECRSIQQSKLNNNVMDRVVWCFRSDSKQWRLVDINLYFEYVCGRTVLHFFAGLQWSSKEALCEFGG